MNVCAAKPNHGRNSSKMRFRICWILQCLDVGGGQSNAGQHWFHIYHIFAYICPHLLLPEELHHAAAGLLIKGLLHPWSSAGYWKPLTTKHHSSKEQIGIIITIIYDSVHLKLFKTWAIGTGVNNAQRQVWQIMTLAPVWLMSSWRGFLLGCLQWEVMSHHPKTVRFRKNVPIAADW